jgi:zinc/manganese transport system substrate-binding protein
MNPQIGIARAVGRVAVGRNSITDPRITQRFASETGAVIGGTLYGDALSPGGEADTYIRMLRHDIAMLKSGTLEN